MLFNVFMRHNTGDLVQKLWAGLLNESCQPHQNCGLPGDWVERPGLANSYLNQIPRILWDNDNESQLALELFERWGQIQKLGRTFAWR